MECMHQNQDWRKRSFLVVCRFFSLSFILYRSVWVSVSPCLLCILSVAQRRRLLAMHQPSGLVVDRSVTFLHRPSALLLSTTFSLFPSRVRARVKSSSLSSFGIVPWDSFISSHPVHKLNGEKAVELEAHHFLFILFLCSSPSHHHQLSWQLPPFVQF